VDPERGTFLLALMAIYIGGALTLFALRAASLAEGKRFALLSREGALVANNLLLTVILGVVLLGTLYPILAEAMGDKVSIGPPYYNAVTGPVALILFSIMVAGPLLKWRRDDGKVLLARLPLMVAAAMLVLAALIVFGGSVGILPLLGMAVAAFVAVGSLAPLWKRNLRRTPLTVWGMVIAHFGIAVGLAGMAAERAFIQEKLVAAAPGDMIKVGPYQVKFVGVKPVAGPNWTAIDAEIRVMEPAGIDQVLRPQARDYPGLMGAAPVETKEADFITLAGGHLFANIGLSMSEGGVTRYQIAVKWMPLVWWIWLGGGLIALGGALALIGRAQLFDAWRRRRRAKAVERFA
jgi:cytochrome c-type biogenesis protein CcmF